MNYRAFNPVRIHRSLDWIGGIASGERDWKARIRESGLPDNVQSLIHDVVGKSRLFAFERVQIADELIAHFEDGNRFGKSFEYLAEQFGDANLTAKLIRNSKLRNRPMGMKVARIAGMGFGGMLVAYVIALAIFHSGKPNPSTDYSVQLNAPVLKTPESERAWPIYRDVWAKWEFCEGPGARFEEIYFRNPGEDDDYRLIRPGDAGWDDAVERLSKSKELLDNLREGGKKRHLGLPLYSRASRYSPEDQRALFPGREPIMDPFEDLWGIKGWSDDTELLMADSLIGILLPHVQTFRNSTRILHVDTRLAFEQSDTERAIQNIEAIFNFANQAAEADFLVCALVGYAVCTLGYDLVDEIIHDHLDKLSDDHLKRIHKAIQSNDIEGFINFEGERYSVKDIIQRVYTDDGNGDGHMTPEGLEIMSVASDLWGIIPETEDNFGFMNGIFKARTLTGPIALLFVASRREVTDMADELLDKIIADFDRPLWEGNGALDKVEELLKTKEFQTKYLILAEMMPAYAQLRYAMQRLMGNQDGMSVALAAIRFERDHGVYPETIDQLVPEYLEAVPIDRKNGEPLGYAKSDKGFKVYSVGSDGDDDGGRPILVNKGGSFPPPGETGEVPLPANQFTFTMGKFDGDWVIFPRNPER